METPAACEMDRLPEELLVNVLSLTSPIDACRAAAVARAFRAAADSDAVWSGFLPRNLPRLAKRELPRTPMSKKELFRRLSVQPALLPHKMMVMQLDKVTGAKCYTLSSSALKVYSACSTTFSDCDPAGLAASSTYRKKSGRRFLQALCLPCIRGRVEIDAKLQRNMLSENTTYAVYMVFHLVHTWYGFDFPLQEASVGVAGSESTRRVCMGYLHGDRDEVEELLSLGVEVSLPLEKEDGWMEIELGEFHNQGGNGGGEVAISLGMTPRDNEAGGLLVWGIEFRNIRLDFN